MIGVGGGAGHYLDVYGSLEPLLPLLDEQDLVGDASARLLRGVARVCSFGLGTAEFRHIYFCGCLGKAGL